MAQMEEPKGWPLKRAISDAEWRQVAKAMVVRRVPEGRSISRNTLINYAQDDILATIESGKLYIESGSQLYVHASGMLDQLLRHEILREGVVGYNVRYPAMEIKNIFRTNEADEFMALLPRHIEAVLNFFPVTNELEFLALLTSEPETDLPKQEPLPDIADLFGPVNEDLPF
jgi:hypothetical protein